MMSRRPSPSKPPLNTPADIERCARGLNMVALSRVGYSENAIGRKYGMTKQAVSLILHQHGVRLKAGQRQGGDRDSRGRDKWERERAGWAAQFATILPPAVLRKVFRVRTLLNRPGLPYPNLFTLTKLERIAFLWNDGADSVQIARHIGITVNHVRSALGAMRSSGADLRRVYRPRKRGSTG